MNEVMFKLSDILKNAKYRPDGYYEDVVSNGIILGEYVSIDYNKAINLIEKYSEKNPIHGFKNDPNIWGPILWSELHSRPNKYELDYESEDRWIGIFTSWIPCGKCKNHFIEIIKTNPLDLSSKGNYMKWGINIHNIVNASLGKPLFHLELNN